MTEETNSDGRGAAGDDGAAVFDPVAWTPPPAPSLDRAYPRDAELVPRPLPPRLGTGPEDVAADDEGRLYTGVEDGRILRFRPDDREAETFVRTGGRPLGLRYDPRRAVLYVADARRGLLGVDPKGRIEVLADRRDGVPLSYTNNLDVAPDGTVYFSNPSDRFSPDRHLAAILEGRPSGSLFAYDPDAGRVTRLAGGLNFPNGVAVAHDGDSALVAETTRYRVTRVWLRGERAGRTEIFADALPGFPDGVEADDREPLYWVALPTLRSRVLDGLAPRPLLRRALYAVLSLRRPEPPRYGFVLAFDEDGRVRHDLQDPEGRYARITNVLPRDAGLFLGSLVEERVARIPRPGPPRPPG